MKRRISAVLLSIFFATFFGANALLESGWWWVPTVAWIILALGDWRSMWRTYDQRKEQDV
jgi:hypothetical protein